MTVNYTTNLSLGQPVTGAESGQWGNDVNNAVTSYLDIAISGSLALTSASFTANALTLTNTLGDSSATNIGAPNASSQWTAQYYVLRLSSLAANVTITAPSVSKTYLVVNADATYSATVKASGQTGTSIAPGERATVYYNGTDYIKVTSSVVSNLTGVLPVLNGGTGVTTSTGSGSTVLSTSPTLVTPVLGTPTSGNLANCTFPTLNQNTTGTAAGLSATLAVASGGTGLTSTPANGALDIGNGTGFTRTTLTAGSNVTITNSAGGITIASTNSGGTVTSVTGTAPVVSSGGATPAISMAAASTSTNGYLTSTDWNTFNGKQAAGSYVTSGGALGTPSSGNLANCTFPVLNQNTSGTAAGLSTTLAVTSGGTGTTSLTANNVLLGNGTSAVQVVAPSTSGNLLTSNGTTWTSSGPNTLGYNQTWQDVTASRASGTTYTNSTGKPIQVNVAGECTSGSAILYLTVGGVVISGGQVQSLANLTAQVGAIIPPGATYVLSVNFGTVTPTYWAELR